MHYEDTNSFTTLSSSGRVKTLHSIPRRVIGAIRSQWS